VTVADDEDAERARSMPSDAKKSTTRISPIAAPMVRVMVGTSWSVSARFEQRGCRQATVVNPFILQEFADLRGAARREAITIAALMHENCQRLSASADFRAAGCRIAAWTTPRGLVPLPRRHRPQ
jgi:hypothetical protein